MSVVTCLRLLGGKWGCEGGIVLVLVLGWNGMDDLFAADYILWQL